VTKKEKNDLGILNKCFDGIPMIDVGVAAEPDQPDGQNCGNCKSSTFGFCLFDWRDIFRTTKTHWCDRWRK